MEDQPAQELLMRLKKSYNRQDSHNIKKKKESNRITRTFLKLKNSKLWYRCEENKKFKDKELNLNKKELRQSVD